MTTGDTHAGAATARPGARRTGPPRAGLRLMRLYAASRSPARGGPVRRAPGLAVAAAPACVPPVVMATAPG